MQAHIITSHKKNSQKHTGTRNWEHTQTAEVGSPSLDYEWEGAFAA